MDFRKFSVKCQCLPWQLQLVVPTLLFLAVSSLGSPIETGKSGRSSVFSLFNLKEKSRFWSEDVIHNDFDDLKFSSHGKLSVFNYTNAGNIANYLKLQEVDSIHLPVPMNFIFIGFEGKGSHEFKLLQEEIERWFTKIDHVFEHTRIRHEEVLIPFYKTNMDKMRWHHLPVVSHINYNFSVHAIEIGEKVTSIIEHAINVFGRKDDPVGSRDNNSGGWQVDVDMLDGLLSSLVEYLQLENAYNIFILNPNRDEKKPKYGYRRGLSEPEINLLKENKSLQMKLLQPEGIPENILALTKIQRPLYLKHPMMKFSWTRTEDTDIIEWYNIWLDALDKFGRLYQGRDTAEIIEAKALLLLKGNDQDLKLHLEKVLKSGDYSGFQAECLTYTWIGKDRNFRRRS